MRENPVKSEVLTRSAIKLCRYEVAHRAAVSVALPFALICLTGCVLAKAGTSSGAGTKDGAPGQYPPAWVRNLAFPEDRDWLGDAGLSEYKSYASYLRPNVGIPESELGMSMKQFREIEKQIALSVLSERPKDVLDKIKREKFGVITTKAGSLARPASVTNRQFMKWFNALPKDVKAESMAEIKNHNRLTGAINGEVFDYLLAKTDAVLKSNGIDPATKKIARAKALVAGAYYFACEAMQYEPIAFTWGPGSATVKRVEKMGAFIMDRPRGVCNEQSLTFVHLLNSKGYKFGISAAHCNVETPTRLSGEGSSHYMLNLNHAVGIARYKNKYLESYDITKRYKIDSDDPDASSLWVTGHSGYELKPPYGEKYPLSSFMQKEGDPISTMTQTDFQSIDKNVNKKIREAVKS